jgi:hypothetical protein
VTLGIFTTRSSDREDHISALELSGAVLPSSASSVLLILALGNVAVKAGPAVAGDDWRGIASHLSVLDRTGDSAGNGCCRGNNGALCYVNGLNDFKFECDGLQQCLHQRQRLGEWLRGREQGSAEPEPEGQWEQRCSWCWKAY